MRLTIIFVISSFVFGGCSLFEGDEKAEVTFRLGQSEFLNQNNILIEISDGRNVFRVEEFVDFESKGCFGCMTHYTFEINKTAIQDSGGLPDSLYVVVGGNSISDPVDY